MEDTVEQFHIYGDPTQLSQRLSFSKNRLQSMEHLLRIFANPRGTKKNYPTGKSSSSNDIYI